MAADWANKQKAVDAYNFVKAEDFFRNLDQVASGGEQASTVSKHLFNESLPVPERRLVLIFDNDRALSLQFVRPRVWRMQCNLHAPFEQDARETKTKHTVQPSLAKLIHVLDIHDKFEWNVELISTDGFLILQSSVKTYESWVNVTQLWVQRQPFQITAYQSLTNISTWTSQFSYAVPEKLKLQEVPGRRPLVVWQMSERGIRYQGKSTILSVQKPSTARYLGFGEQGGSSLIKDKTFMDYFNYDNLEYESVYGNGPLDSREPLYHSEPFWIEVNRHPEYQSKTATFVANYSQICIDLGVTSNSEIRVATRFDPAEFYIFAEQNVSDIISQYTAIVGRPWLKPRYALGYGQGCYGYDTREKVEKSVAAYEENKFPLDTMHIDVDMQKEYRTFTVDQDEHKFPNPDAMFSDLRGKGVKCCTNITPFINGEKDDNYKTLQELIKKKYYVSDERLLKGTVVGFQDQRYQCYEKGALLVSDPNVDRPSFGDQYVFGDSFNRKAPYHGGVNYGKNLGKSGYYPDLNRKEVRKWWGEQYKDLINFGLEFVWQDMTSPAISKEYGDMKSFPCRLLLTSPDDPQIKRPAIEIWSLYAYNLHKATFEGWNRSPMRKGKRNFIIGRGSFSGMSRFAGLWTGDNSGTWDFLNISISQALALGLCGMVIAGGDVGGFMGGKPGEKYTDPELLIRWYAACFLLPWFRNHYNGKPGQKLFQEPFEYKKYYKDHTAEIGTDNEFIFNAVLPIARYFTRLRYSLMQMLYDAMFENLFTGMPIVKPLAITEASDETLYLENERFLSNEFIVRKDLLVAPVTTEEESSKGWRTVYLPGPDSWFKFNLSCNDPVEEKPHYEDFVGYALASKIPGGRRLNVDCRITTAYQHLSDITPMYIREGAIIPKLKPRRYVPDRTGHNVDGPDQLTFHVYPGKNNFYDMYLDDGVSRDSAPVSCFSKTSGPDSKSNTTLVADEEAKGCYRQVRITHDTYLCEKGAELRRIRIKTEYDGYFADNVKRDFGEYYHVVLWHETPKTVKGKITCTGTQHYKILEQDEKIQAVVLEVAIEADNNDAGITIEQEIGRPKPRLGKHRKTDSLV
ncbi:MAG: hypothetical protein Q9195_005161 [Heterodermia aff. obscurata]